MPEGSSYVRHSGQDGDCVRVVLLLSMSCERTDPGVDGATHMFWLGTTEAPDALELTLSCGQFDVRQNV